MSKVAIVGDPSGTGTFTISAPNGNTDRTLVLPDEAGTVLTSASPVSSLNATGTPDETTFLRGDGTWGAPAGGVTSLNGETGSITNTNLDSIGSHIIGRPANNVSYAHNTTIAGSSLYSMGAVNYYAPYWSNSYGSFQNAAHVRTLPGTW